MAVRPKSVLSLSLGLLLSLVAIPPAAAQEYVVGPRDVLTITVWGQPDLSRDYPVDPDGLVPFPLVGRVKAGGLTTRAFAARLSELLEKDYLVNPQVMVSVKEYLSQKVLVLGEAGRPGVFYLTGPTTLLEILSKAGGLAKGAGKQILLVRDQHAPDHGGPTANTILRLNVDKVQAGTGSENIPIQAGDTVLVPKDREDTFFIFGEVKKPGAYPLDKETNVLEGITIAGGFTDKAAPGRTRVIRVNATGQQVLDIDMNDIIKRGQRDKAIRLQANDVVVVPESFF
ncbi:MAG: polysaccharide biosynthesis/export family protein [Candidatus Rokuibacteriota bacterium]